MSDLRLQTTTTAIDRRLAATFLALKLRHNGKWIPT